MEVLEKRLSQVEKTLNDLLCGKQLSEPEKNLPGNCPFDFVKAFVTKDNYMMCEKVSEFLGVIYTLCRDQPLLTDEYRQCVQKNHLNVSLIRLQNGKTELHPLVAKEYLTNLGAPDWFMKAAEEWVKQYEQTETIKFLEWSTAEMEKKILNDERNLLYENPENRKEILENLERGRQTFQKDRQMLMELRKSISISISISQQPFSIAERFEQTDKC
jgi:hypothetical protein